MKEQREVLRLEEKQHGIKWLFFSNKNMRLSLGKAQFGLNTSRNWPKSVTVIVSKTQKEDQEQEFDVE